MQRVRVQQRWLHVLLGNIGLSVLFSLVLVNRTFSALPPVYEKTPVLFVHGHGLSSGDWQEISNHLLTLGYPKAYLHAIDIVPNTMANVRAATTVIAPAVESLLAQAAQAAHKVGYQGQELQRVDIVSHSMGAMSSRWYAAKLHPERVRTWIALAGANHGTNALCNHNDEGARDLCPAFATKPEQSAIQLALNGTPEAPIDETPFGVGMDREGVTRVPADESRHIAYFTVRIDPDSWIKPARSAVLDGAGGVPVQMPSGVPATETSPGNYLFQSQWRLFWRSVNHCSLLQHADLLRLVAALLAARDA